MKKKFFNTTRLTAIALFSALSGVLYVFGFPISVAFPSFLELNFSDIPVLIGTFALGPLSGALIVVFKILIKLVIKGTSSIFVGELSDLLIGLAFSLSAGFLYEKNRTAKGAAIALTVGTALSVGIALLSNRLIVIPFYVQVMFGGNWEPLLGLMRPLFPSITQDSFYLIYLFASCLPFNVLRSLVAIGVTLPVYKRISRALERLNDKLAPDELSPAEEKKQKIVAIVLFVGFILVLTGVSLLRYFLK